MRHAPSVDLLTASTPEHPALDMALSAALLEGVARGGAPETVRVYSPGPTVAFGRLDRLRPGFRAACLAARSHARVPVLRLGGGRAAAYDQESVVVEVVSRQSGVFGGLEHRFTDLVELLERALAETGVAVECGELPGEYCPGRFSLHLPGGPKIAGVAQRVVSGASLVTAVVVVGGGESLRATIADVYDALEVPVDPARAGAVHDHHPGIPVAAVSAAVLGAVRQRYGTVPSEPSTGVLERGAVLLASVAVKN